MNGERSHRLRIKFQKTGELRFLSHLDLVRAFERGARRADLPLSLTQGFSPHAKISFGPPLPVGVSSECEYVDIIIEERPELKKIAVSLQAAFPADLSCNEVRYAEHASPSLMSLTSLGSYQIEASIEPQLAPDEVKHILDSGSKEEELLLPAKDGDRAYESRKILKKLTLERVEPSGNKCLIQIGFLGLLPSAGGVRPDVLVKGLLSLGRPDVQVVFHKIHRTGLYYCEDEKLVAP